MSRLYIVQHETNTNSSIDAGVLFKADNVGDLSYQQFDNEDVSNHGTPDDYYQPQDLTTTKTNVSSATNGYKYKLKIILQSLFPARVPLQRKQATNLPILPGVNKE